MSVDTRPGIMDQTIASLDAKNAEVGGFLFASFGRGNSRALIFPTPLEVAERTITASEFLVVTRDGPKSIEVRRTGSGIGSEAISRLVRPWLGKKHGFLDLIYGYDSNRLLRIAGSLFIYPERTEDWRGTSLFSYDQPTVYNNCRLIDADPNWLEQAVQLNLNRVEALQRSAQRVEEIIGLIEMPVSSERGSDRLYWNKILVLLGMVTGGIAGAAGDPAIKSLTDSTIPLATISGMAVGGSLAWVAVNKLMSSRNSI